MSDMQKGLLHAVSRVLPLAEHRLCARHIYANWSKTWRGAQLKKKFFSCAWSTYPEKFNDNLKAIGELNKDAVRALVWYPPKTWSRAFFRTTSCCWIVDNNFSESLNAWIDDFRYLPIIRMIDGIRIKLMTKWANAEKNVERWNGHLSPKCSTLFDENRELAMRCTVFFNGDDGYEVTEGDDRHSVFIHKKQCTCRMWELIGIPCQHVVTALYHAKLDPVILISRYYHKETYLAGYRTKFQPIQGKRFWEIEKFQPLEPPPVANLPGQPRVNRVRTEEKSRRRKNANAHQERQENHIMNADQRPSGPEKMTKRGSTIKCSICTGEGHNMSTCPKKPKSSTVMTEKRKRQGQSEKLTQESRVGSKPRGGRAFYRTTPEVGFGVRVDLDSGRTEGTRAIMYQGPGQTTSTPQLPFSPRGLMWNGHPAITTSTLLANRDTNLICSASRKKAPTRRGRH